MTPVLLIILAAPPAEDVVLGAVEAALRGDARVALERFDEAARRLPEHREQVRSAKGLAELLNRRRSSARRHLEAMPVYRAMAQVHEGAGGLSRARETLAKAAQKKGSGPGPDFLAALAFSAAGRQKRADELLARALSASESALSEAFAPDPAVALARVAIATKLSKEGRLRLAQALLDAGRRAEAIRIADEEGAHALLADAWAPVDPRRALRYAEKLDDPAREAAHLVALGREEKARALVAKLDEGEPSELRLKTRLLLGTDPERALALAQESARMDPKSDEAPYLVAEALLANGRLDRAYAFAEELLRRRPADIDPFDLLLRIDTARGRKQELRALDLRSRAHRAERKKMTELRRRREAVISAVRDAEAGLGTTGLETVRAADPTYALVVDLALARMGRPGTARAARDRILAACDDDLRRFLAHDGPWERAHVDVSPYGHAQKASVSLSAADPGRCGGRVLRK